MALAAPAPSAPRAVLSSGPDLRLLRREEITTATLPPSLLAVCPMSTADLGTLPAGESIPGKSPCRGGADSSTGTGRPR